VKTDVYQGKSSALFGFCLRHINLALQCCCKEEVPMRYILAVLLMVGAFAADAAVTLPEALTKRIKGDPAAYLDEVAGLIAGYGADGAIDAAELDHVVTLERAGARAGAMAKLMRADLDGDGAVLAAEMAVLEAAAAAEDRGKLAVLFTRSDTDGDGTVSPTEMQAYASAAGLSAYSDAKAGQLHAVMAFDGNGDGKVTMEEVKAGLAALGLA
jgi:Ca2+-binding EF-hand superfamily protein